MIAGLDIVVAGAAGLAVAFPRLPVWHGRSLQELSITTTGAPNTPPVERWADLYETARRLAVVERLADLGFKLPISSGYRTREVQDVLLQRGYHPSPRSRHLSGRAVDLDDRPGVNDREARERLEAVARSSGLFSEILDEGGWLHLGWGEVTR